MFSLIAKSSILTSLVSSARIARHEVEVTSEDSQYCCGYHVGAQFRYQSSTDRNYYYSTVDECRSNSLHAYSNTPGTPKNKKEYRCNVVGLLEAEAKEVSAEETSYCCGKSVGASFRYQSSTDRNYYWSTVDECRSNSLHAYSNTPGTPKNKKEYTCNVVGLLEETQEEETGYCCGYSRGDRFRYQSSTDRRYYWSTVDECRSNSLHGYSATPGTPGNKKEYRCNVVGLLEEEATEVTAEDAGCPGGCQRISFGAGNGYGYSCNGQIYSSSCSLMESEQKVEEDAGCPGGCQRISFGAGNGYGYSCNGQIYSSSCSLMQTEQSVSASLMQHFANLLSENGVYKEEGTTEGNCLCEYGGRTHYCNHGGNGMCVCGMNSWDWKRQSTQCGRHR